MKPHLSPCKTISTLIACFALGTMNLCASWNLPDAKAPHDPAAQAAPASDPLTYRDADGFQNRAKILTEGVAKNELGGWRRGYFTGGDPGKFVTNVVMAKLLLNPDDADARAIMNDDRSYKEQYHFAAENWARFLPAFGGALTTETQGRFSEKAARAGYFGQEGTENHKLMWLTSGNVLPDYIGGNRFSNMGREEALARGKKDLHDYVKSLYLIGQGEWDSSTYLTFCVHGMLNIYDFARDPETRLLAKAALDWYLAGYALKYRDGVYTAPNQRGFAQGPMSTIADQSGWLWWGSHRKLTASDTKGFLYAMHPATSSWRPNKVLSNIATKNLPALPFDARNTKANYWYGPGIPPKGHEYQESVHVAKHFTLGSLLTGFGGQITRFQLVADSPDGAIVFTGGHPRRSDHTGKLLNELSYRDGNGRYDQSAQVGAALVNISNVPESDSLAYSFFSIPGGATRPGQRGKWWVMQAGETFVGVYPLSEQSRIAESELSEKQTAANADAAAKGKDPKEKTFPILRFDGRKTGFILQAADTTQFPSLEDFAAALGKLKVDTGNFASALEVGYTNLAGRTLRMKYGEGKSHAAVEVDGKPVQSEEWSAVYDSPYVRAKDGVLTVNDGSEGYVVDFTGDMPVYKPW